MTIIARRLTIFALTMTIFAFVFSALAAQPGRHALHGQNALASACDMQQPCPTIL